jgi:hypothetical protein
MPEINLAPSRQPTTHFLTGGKTLTNGLEWCFLSPIRDENHVYNEDAEARAGHWLHGRLAARLPSFGHRGIEILNQRTIFRNPRLPVNRGFFAF